MIERKSIKIKGFCECGCGQRIKNRFVTHHNFRIPETSEVLKRRIESRKGYRHSEETKRKMSETAKGRKPSPEAVRKSIESRKKTALKYKLKPQLCTCGCGGWTNPGRKFIKGHTWIGRNHSKEAKKKISKNAKGNKGRKFNEEHRERISKALMGIVRGSLSQEHREKISAANKGRIIKWRDKLTGENHWNWKGGKSFEPYPTGFNPLLKDYIKERDDHQCQNPYCYMKGIILNIHHVDYNKENIEEENLITLCAGCNTRANYNKEYWQELYSKIMEKKYDFSDQISATNI